VPLVRPRPVYTTVTRRSWRQLDADAFCARLSASTLCRPEAWPEFDVDGLVQLYNDEIMAALDCLIPVRTVRSRRRLSDPWFDDECREAKRHTRRLERSARRTSDTDAAATASALWITQRRAYRGLLRHKREALWTAKVDAERSSSTQLWRSVDALLGRGRIPPSHDIGAMEFHQYFEAKVAGVRASTADALPPSFTAAPPGCEMWEFRPVTVADITRAVPALPDNNNNNTYFYSAVRS